MRASLVIEPARGRFEAFVIDIIELDRGHGIAGGEPFIEVNVAAARAAERLAGDNGGFGADGAVGHGALRHCHNSLTLF
jgi:hypothetical protein